MIVPSENWKVNEYIETLPEPIRSKVKQHLLIYGDAYIHFTMEVINPTKILRVHPKDDDDI